MHLGGILVAFLQHFRRHCWSIIGACLVHFLVHFCSSVGAFLWHYFCSMFAARLVQFWCISGAFV